MSSIIEELYLSQLYNDIIDPDKELEETSVEYRLAYGKFISMEDTFYKQLNKELQNAYDNLNPIDLNNLRTAHAFANGFKLATKIMAESFLTKPNNS